MRSVFVFLSLLAVHFVQCDIYLHSPRGSNDRLNEKSANRKNANRAFDSQNNNRGGYNVGDKNANAAANEAGQYNMQFFQSGTKYRGQESTGKSLLTIEWTNQHGCGGNENSDPHKLNCNVVLQYMCEKDPSEKDPSGKPAKFQMRNAIIRLISNSLILHEPQNKENQSEEEVT